MDEQHGHKRNGDFQRGGAMKLRLAIFVAAVLATAICAAQYSIPSSTYVSPSGSTTYTFNSASSGINGACASSSATCTVSGLTAATNGDVVVLAVAFARSTLQTISSATGNSATLVKCTSSACATYNSVITTDIAAFMNSSSGGTSYTVTMSATSTATWAFAVLDFTPSATASYDTGNATSYTSTANPVGPSLSPSGTSDLFIQAIGYGSGSGTISIGGGYTIPTGFKVNFTGTKTAAFAYLANQSSYTAPTWTIASGSGPLSAMAIQ
jgi:hypothetical protein